MPDELLRYRSEFPILERTTYLISNSLGAMPRDVEDALRHYTDCGARVEFAPGRKNGGCWRRKSATKSAR